MPPPCPRFEPLEPRLLCSATVSFKEGKIIIVGDDAPTVVFVTVSPDKKEVRVTIDGVLVDPKPNAGPTTGVKRDKVKRVNVTTGAGNDNITVGIPDDTFTPEQQRKRFIARAVVDAGAGNDFVLGGPQADILIGGPGDDTLNGGDRPDFLSGGTGNDTLIGDLNKDTLFGQDGNDTLFGDSGRDALYGMNGDDTLTGGRDDDFLNGGPGNNVATDRNESPHVGKQDDVQQYLQRLVILAVPQRFRAAVFT